MMQEGTVAKRDDHQAPWQGTEPASRSYHATSLLAKMCFAVTLLWCFEHITMEGHVLMFPPNWMWLFKEQNEALFRFHLIASSLNNLNAGPCPYSS